MSIQRLKYGPVPSNGENIPERIFPKIPANKNITNIIVFVFREARNLEV